MNRRGDSVKSKLRNLDEKSMIKTHPIHPVYSHSFPERTTVFFFLNHKFCFVRNVPCGAAMTLTVFLQDYGICREMLCMQRLETEDGKLPNNSNVSFQLVFKTNTDRVVRAHTILEETRRRSTQGSNPGLRRNERLRYAALTPRIRGRYSGPSALMKCIGTK